MEIRGIPKIHKILPALILVLALLAWTGIARADTSLNKQLQQAVQQGDLERVKDLLDKGADINKADRDKPVIRSQGYLEVVKLLLDRGIRVDALGQRGAIALEQAAGWNDLRLAKRLLDKGVDVNATPLNGVTALFMAAMKGNTDMVKLLLEHGADVNTPDDYGRTPLLMATTQQQAEVVKLLLAKGAKVNERHEGNRTPLMAAAGGGRNSMVRMLLGKGADVNRTDRCGRTPLMAAAANGKLGTAKLLLDAGARISGRDCLVWTALTDAAEKGHAEVVRLLLASGADVNAKSFYDWTPLMRAALNGHTAVTQVLLDNGAEINAKTKYGWTALMCATLKGHLETAKVLADRGADIDAKNVLGFTAGDYPMRKGPPKFEDLLRIREAKPKSESSGEQLETGKALTEHEKAIESFFQQKGKTVEFSDSPKYERERGIVRKYLNIDELEREAGYKAQIDIAVADLNNDGANDILAIPGLSVICGTGPCVKILIHQKDGKWKELANSMFTDIVILNTKWRGYSDLRIPGGEAWRGDVQRIWRFKRWGYDVYAERERAIESATGVETTSTWIQSRLIDIR